MYRKCLKIFFGAAAASALLRALLKILYIDIESGFYLGGQPLAWLLAAVMAAALAAMAFFSLREKDEVTAPLRVGRAAECAAVMLGAAIAAVSAAGLPRVLAIDPDELLVNRLPRWLQLTEQLLGIASGLAMLYIAFYFFSGASRIEIQGTVALIPVGWQILAMVDRFISFREVSTASDQFIETLYLVCATMFFLHHAKSLGGIAKSRRAVVFWGLAASLPGLALSAGQGAAVVVLGEGISGPPLSQCLLTVAFALYAVTLAASTAYPPRENPPA